MPDPPEKEAPAYGFSSQSPLRPLILCGNPCRHRFSRPHPGPVEVFKWRELPSAGPFLYTVHVKRIRITRHARNRMRWHRIGEDLVQQTLQAPDWEEPSIANRVNRWKRVGDRFLRVTFNDEPE